MRLRFDLAHECGHLVMHQGVETGDRETEIQAHRFASAFLLPTTAFVTEFPRRAHYLDWPGLYTLKRRWGVSVRAIVRRAYDLGMIDAAQYRTANVHLARTGQAKGEAEYIRLAQLADSRPGRMLQQGLKTPAALRRG